MQTISYARQSIDGQDIKEVVEALKSDWLTQGPKTREFESALCKYTGAKYAVVVSSGTAALHLSMMALGVVIKDKVLTSPITFSASANCVIYVGAKPEFIDIDSKTYHLDLDKLKDFLKVPSQRKGVRVVVPVHFMGTVAEMFQIRKICDKHGIKIVEDAAHALGAKYRLKNKAPWIKVGSCKHSDVTIFSFHPIKHITTGEGGAILTNDKKIYLKAVTLRHHGIAKSVSQPGWFYDIADLGFNYRITDFQCALGVSQLKKLDRMVRERRRLVSIYNQHFSKLKGVKIPFQRPNSYASYHLYVLRFEANKRNKLYDYLRKNNILTQVNYIPVHLLSFYAKKFGYKRGDFPIAEKYFRECLSLPLYVGLSKIDQLKVIKEITRFFEQKNTDKGG